MLDLEHTRNFSVIAHVDHGKSTLSDCLLQVTGNVTEKDRLKGQVCDTLKVERDRGITVKAQTASMIYEDPRTNIKYILNLIDTPGHVDFSYEVTRSLASCQGALLLVDSSQSVQAQTLVNFQKAKGLGIAIVPVVTKIDLPNAQPEETALNMGTTFDLDPDSVVMTSAKKQLGIDEVLQAVVDHLPCPRAACLDPAGRLHARIVDSWFDEHRGVVCLVQIVGGTLKEGIRISNHASRKESADISGGATTFSVQEVGILTPKMLRTNSLSTGQVGYVIAGMRATRQARIGDTMFAPAEWPGSSEPDPLQGYEPAIPMLYASVYPVQNTELDNLYAAVDRLCLNDSSIQVSKDMSGSLGAGLRCGFLGFLHMEVFNQRLKDEFNIEIVMTTPSVPYIVQVGDDETTRRHISCVSEWPEQGQARNGSSKNAGSLTVLEPMVKVTIVVPAEHYGAMVDIIKDRRGLDMEVVYLDDGQIKLLAEVPWQEVVCDMSDQVKHSSAGYASFDYEESGHRVADLVKVEVAVNDEVCDALSFVSHKTKAVEAGRKLLARLKEVLSRQQFEIRLQAKVGAKAIASEKLSAYRKDVLSRSGKMVGGGDVTRKKKLLEKQKEGKKRAKMVGKVEIDQEAFWTVLQR